MICSALHTSWQAHLRVRNRIWIAIRERNKKLESFNAFSQCATFQGFVNLGSILIVVATIRHSYFWLDGRCGGLIEAIVCQYFINHTQSALLQQLIVTETQERNGPMVTLTVNNILMVCADCNITTVAGGILAIIMSSMSDVASGLYN